MPEYIPSPLEWVAKQVKEYEESNGTVSTTFSTKSSRDPSLRDLPVIIMTNIGRKTGGVRKSPLMRVVDSKNYVLIGSLGGSPKHPLWYHNLKVNPSIKIRDGSDVYSMKAHEVLDPIEKQRLWKLAVKAFPPYDDCQKRTNRIIPVFLATPLQ